MGEVTNINILGTCISRDTFSVKPEIEKYKVLRYVNEFDPFYFNTQGMQIDKEKFDAYDVAPLISNFRKRCMYLDAVKKIMDFIKEADSDFLVIDSAICRLQTMRLGDACVAVSNYKEGFFNSLKDEGITDVGVEEKFHVPLEEMEERLKGFTSEVLKVYPPEKIILLEIQGSFVHYDGTKLTPFGAVDKVIDKNKRMKLGFDILKKQLAGCHIIPMLDAVMSDTNHWLKVAMLHYTKDYYEYAYECMNVIAQRLPRDEEEKQIALLHKEYTDRYYKNFYNLLAFTLAKSTEDKNAEITVEKKKKNHLNMQSVLLRDIAEKTVRKEKPDIDIKTAVIYGWTRVGEFVMSILAENNIKPVAVIENVAGEKAGSRYIEGGAPILKRGSKIPKADCVVVADLKNADILVPKLKQMTNKPVYTAEEFAGFFKKL